ncbi:MAG: carbon monoxide dehydrogenase subunit G [Proteobacteria bacterium]|nr:carbon monoxide dehydrogenase subunit G [Pseudomonadota bacterium]
MDMTGERRIPAPRQTVWDALNDPEVLKASIPGCETLEKTSDNQMKASAAVKIGPISARFNGNVTLSDIDPPNGYRITGEGQGGVAGFAKGGAAVSLADDGETATLLTYEVHAQVGGKLAQLGARLVDASAKQMADAFFDRFTQQVTALAPAPEGAPAPALAPTAPAPAGTAATGVIPVPAATPAKPPPPPAAPPSAISIWALIPREIYGFPLVAWIGSGIFAIIVLLALASMRGG